MMTTGFSMGDYHALNFFLQHPDILNKVVALSGVYDAGFLLESLEEMRLFTKIHHQIIFGTKIMVGLLIVIVKLKLLCVQVLVPGNNMVFLLITNLRKILNKRIFQLGSLSGSTMLLTIGMVVQTNALFP